jgi:site-specific DNA-methyltransferase (adenine-specific)
MTPKTKQLILKAMKYCKESERKTFILNSLDMIENKAYNMCCIEGMKMYPDKYFDLAIVDPPYGLGKKLKPRGGMIGKSFKGMGADSWDAEPPTKEYWEQLFRVSKNQIVWGGNYFIDYLKPTQCFLIWDKMNGTNPMADAEFAWTSIENKVARIFRMHHFSYGYDDKIHPTQKPTKLYDWILQKYAKPTDKILDTHLGSGSSRIAAHKAKLSFTGFEIDSDYFKAQEKRFNEFKRQLTLF